MTDRRDRIPSDRQQPRGLATEVVVLAALGASLLTGCGQGPAGDADTVDTSIADEPSSRARCPAPTEVPREVAGPYDASVTSLERHETPAWYRDAKFGIFIHWGPYSVPAFADATLAEGGIPAYAEWYWFFLNSVKLPSYLEHHRSTFGADVLYDDFLRGWSTPAFDADDWASVIEASGARYTVLVTKHHDGVALWGSGTTRRDTVDQGPGRDFVCEFSAAARERDLKLGLYYSLYEWYHPAWPGDETGSNRVGPLRFPAEPPIDPFTGKTVPYLGYEPTVDDYVADHVMPQLAELTDVYRPDLIWYDGGWDRPTSYWRSAELAARYYNRAASWDQEVAINPRSGLDGDFDSLEYELREDIADRTWEATRGIGFSFGYSAGESEDDYLTADELVDLLVDVVAKNGNLLLNIGPTAEGAIPEAQERRLRDVGDWLAGHGEAIYGSRPWTRPADGDLRYTVGEAFYATSLTWPGDELRLPGDVPFEEGATVVLLGAQERTLDARRVGDEIVVTMPARTDAGRFAWTVRLEAPSTE